MKARKIVNDVYWLGAVDWDRRLFDSLIPLPDGTSYNAYLIRGSEKTVLLDSVDPAMADILLAQLEDIPKIDYLIAHHAEQDHAGTIPRVLDKYPNARVIATAKGKGLLVDHLGISPDRVKTVDDGEVLSLGNKILEFIHTPWVHWPETMSTHLKEDGILFSCDFFGSHLATTDLYVKDKARVYEAAKRYYAEIMMPFRNIVGKNLAKVMERDLKLIAPSHGPIYDEPGFILDAYADWTGSPPKNRVVIPYVSMHGSTAKMVEYLVSGLAARGVSVDQFDLAVTDIGKLAIALVDAATIVIGTPTVHVGPHPLVFYAAHLANALRPKLKFASVIGSYGWASKAVEQIAGLIPNLKVELIPPVLCKGLPQKDDFTALDKLAEAIALKHKENQLI
ncbi:MAG: FprA family A-type flavoprotein [Candidatus Omnitrophota bacterium]|nr:FprA family A-type flavoprotein [bacterium]MBU3930005.1 FprA family A-type flavoprotein [bacterium]